MFGLGIGELMMIAVVALLVLGPEKLPEAARSLGKALGQFRRASDDLTREVLTADQNPSPKPAITQAQDTVAKQEAPTTQTQAPALPQSEAPHSENPA